MANAYDYDNELITQIQSKEGHELEFWKECQNLFEREETARMEIFKKRDPDVMKATLDRLEKLNEDPTDR